MTNRSPEPSPCEVIVLTALSLEFEAVMRHLEEVKELVHPSGTIYHQGTFAGTHRTWRIAVAQIGMGGPKAATETERAINYFRPQITLFVGISGGLKDVKRGDVVAASKVYAYESGKVGSQFQPRPEVWRASYALEQRAQTEARGNEWLTRLGGSSPGAIPQVHVGALAAGEKVLASTQSDLFRLLKATYGDTLAVEMEGHGFLAAVHANQSVQALVIRGISDLVDDKVEADASGMQPIAAQRAAAFAFQVLARLVLPPSDRGHGNTPPDQSPSIPPFLAATPSQDLAFDSLGTSRQRGVSPQSIIKTARLLIREHLNRPRLYLLIVLSLVPLFILLGEWGIGIHERQVSKTPISVSPVVTAQSTTTILPQTKWNIQTSHPSNNLASVVRSDSQFVAVGWYGTILTSSDGSTWMTPQNSGVSSTDNLYGVAWLNAQFIAVGQAGTILTSSNGITWTSRASHTSRDLRGIAWSGSQFVVVGDHGTILTSPDGTTWTLQNSGISDTLFGVARSNSLFVAVGLSNKIFTSPNGSIWEPRDVGPTQGFLGITWSGSQFVVVGRDGTIFTSSNGTTWTSRASNTSHDLRGVASSGSHLVVVGNAGTILTSRDGTSWARQNLGVPHTDNLVGVTWSDSHLVVVGDTGTILTSPA